MIPYFLSKFSNKIDGVIHVGAHHGQEIIHYRKFTFEKIIFFEPIKDIFDELIQNVKDEKNVEEMIEDINESRMNIIGQNGNDGLHYDKIEPTTKELDKLENHLSGLKYHNDELYYEEDYFGDLERITDTTQTLIVDKPEEEKNEKRTLKYRKRK